MSRVLKRPAQKKTKRAWMSHETAVMLDPVSPPDAMAVQLALLAVVENWYPSWTMPQCAEKAALILHSAITAIQTVDVLPAFGQRKRLSWHVQVIRACCLRLSVENRYYTKLDTLNQMLPLIKTAHENLSIPASQRYKYTGPRGSSWTVSVNRLRQDRTTEHSAGQLLCGC